MRTRPAIEHLTERLWEALRGVPDPEIPSVSVVDMGMVHRVEVDGARASIVILPTFTGCPALAVIEQDVATAAGGVEGIDAVSVSTSFDPPWTSDRITAEGRDKLRRFGLAPPSGEGPVLIGEIGLPRVALCPFCGSRETEADNAFGPTPCRALYYCRACRNPFEQFKDV